MAVALKSSVVVSSSAMELLMKFFVFEEILKKFHAR